MEITTQENELLIKRTRLKIHEIFSQKSHNNKMCILYKMKETTEIDVHRYIPYNKYHQDFFQLTKKKKKRTKKVKRKIKV